MCTVHTLIHILSTEIAKIDSYCHILLSKSMHSSAIILYMFIFMKGRNRPHCCSRGHFCWGQLFSLTNQKVEKAKPSHGEWTQKSFIKTGSTICKKNQNHRNFHDTCQLAPLGAASRKRNHLSSCRQQVYRRRIADYKEGFRHAALSATWAYANRRNFRLG